MISEVSTSGFLPRSFGAMSLFDEKTGVMVIAEGQNKHNRGIQVVQNVERHYDKSDLTGYQIFHT